MKIKELDKLNKMCTAISVVIGLCGDAIYWGDDAFTKEDYEDCVSIIVREQIRKARLNTQQKKGRAALIMQGKQRSDRL